MAVRSPQLSRLALLLEDLSRKVDNITPQLIHSSIDDGYILENDVDGNTVGSYGKQFDGAHMAASLSGPTPPTPTPPSALGALSVGAVGWDGFFLSVFGVRDESVAAPTDFSRVEIHVAPLAEGSQFNTDTALTLAETIETPRGTDKAIPLPPGEYWARLVTRTLSGKKSAPSAAVQFTVTSAVIEEIDAANILIKNAGQILLDANTSLTQKFAAADSGLAAATGRLDDVDDDLSSAFGQINQVPTQISTAKQEAIAAAALDATAKTAAATSEARAAAGLAAGKGANYFQPEPPADGTVYAWAGTVVNSESVQLRDGVEVRRNRVFDPRVTIINRTLGTGRWFGSSGGAGTHTIITDAGPDGKPSTMIRKQWTASPTGNGDTGFQLVPASFLVTAGASISFSGWVRTNSTSSKRAYARIQWRNAAGASIGISDSSSTQTELSGAGWQRLSHSATVPANAERAVLILDIHGVGVRWVPGEQLDGTWVTVEDRSVAGDFLVGDLPDEHTLDYWVDTNAGNTPNRWNSESNSWVPVTDSAAIQAATDAAALDAKTKADAARDAAIDAAKTETTSQITTVNNSITGRVWYGTTAPSAANPSAAKIGETYRRQDGSGNVYEEYTKASSTAWTLRKITGSMVTALDVGQLSAGTASILSAVAQKFAAATASIQTADIKNLFVTDGATMNQAVIDKIFADIVVAKTSVTATAFIGQDALLTNSVTAPKIVASEELWAKIGQFVKVKADQIDTFALDGKLITGAVIRTAASGARSQIDQTGIYSWNSAGQEVFRSANGLVSIMGNFSARGTTQAQTIPPYPSEAIEARFGPEVDFSFSGDPNLRIPGIGFHLMSGTAMLQDPGVYSASGRGITVNGGVNGDNDFGNLAIYDGIAQMNGSEGVTIVSNKGWTRIQGTQMHLDSVNGDWFGINGLDVTHRYCEFSLSNQSIPTATVIGPGQPTLTQQINNGGGHGTWVQWSANDRLKINEGGIYHIHFAASIGGGIGPARGFIEITPVNRGLTLGRSPMGYNEDTMSTDFHGYLASGSHVDFKYFQQSGSTKNITSVGFVHKIAGI